MIPEGIQRDHVLQAAKDFENGTHHRFAESTRYDVVIGGVRYPPKAIVGLAARHVTGQILGPDDFSGGIGSACFRVLTRLGFEIVPKKQDTAPPLVVGNIYTRADLYDLLSVPLKERRGDWDTGYHRYGNDFFIFCGIGTAGRTGHDYHNHFDGTDLVWYGKSRTTFNQPQIQAMLSGDYPVHIFFRSADRDPFEYGGQAHAVDVDEKSSPVKVRWRFDTSSEVQFIRSADEVADDETFVEGAKRRVTVNAYERDPEARRRCIRHYGPKCVACGFDFEAAYGELGRGFIHVHHLRPLSDIGAEYTVDPIADLRPVCPNCHAMIHVRGGAMSIEELKQIIASQKVGRFTS